MSDAMQLPPAEHDIDSSDLMSRYIVRRDRQTILQPRFLTRLGYNGAAALTHNLAAAWQNTIETVQHTSYNFRVL